MSTQNHSMNLKDLLENKPLYSNFKFHGGISSLSRTSIVLKEIIFDCEICETSKPFHNLDTKNNHVIFFEGPTDKKCVQVGFECVSCNRNLKIFSLCIDNLGEEEGQKPGYEKILYSVTKFGEYPQKALLKNKELSKFFKNDKSEHHKAVVCLANGYGVAAYTYMRRIVENNINDLLDLISESVDSSSDLINKISDLKSTSPMSDKIKIANHALPDYLKPDGFNPLGQIYGLLSDGVHSLPDEACLEKAKDLQVCLEFLISELAAHKKNREDFKKRLSALRK